MRTLTVNELPPKNTTEGQNAPWNASHGNWVSSSAWLPLPGTQCPRCCHQDILKWVYAVKLHQNCNEANTKNKRGPNRKLMVYNGRRLAKEASQGCLTSGILNFQLEILISERNIRQVLKSWGSFHYIKAVLAPALAAAHNEAKKIWARFHDLSHTEWVKVVFEIRDVLPR